MTSLEPSSVFCNRQQLSLFSFQIFYKNCSLTIILPVEESLHACSNYKHTDFSAIGICTGTRRQDYFVKSSLIICQLKIWLQLFKADFSFKPERMMLPWRWAFWASHFRCFNKLSFMLRAASNTKGTNNTEKPYFLFHYMSGTADMQFPPPLVLPGESTIFLKKKSMF